MLNLSQILKAIEYNKDHVNRTWRAKDIPEPWALSLNNARQFSWMVALFQSENGMKIDGKLGPMTLSRLAPGIQEAGVPRIGVSNTLIVGSRHIALPQVMRDVGLSVSNYIDDGEPHFKCKKREQNLVNFVLHETCGNTAEGCMDTLIRKGYGVQLILAPDGHLSCHGDLTLEVMSHANQLNKVSIGIEVVNPYSPLYARAPFMDFVKREWWTWVPNEDSKGIKRLLKKRGLDSVPEQYVLPTSIQIRAARLLVPWICELTGIPYRFPTKGLNRKKRKIKGWKTKPKGRPGPGVVAHRDFAGHADGRYMLEDLIGRV